MRWIVYANLARLLNEDERPRFFRSLLDAVPTGLPELNHTGPWAVSYAIDADTEAAARELGDSRMKEALANAALSIDYEIAVRRP